MKAPHVAIAGIVAIVAFSALLLVRALIDGPPGPWLTDDVAAFERARDDRKGVVIDFTVTWSVPSVELSRTLDKLAGDLDRDFVRVRFDVSNDTEHDQELRTRYDAKTLPAVVFLDARGHELTRVNQSVDEMGLRRVMVAAAKHRAVRD